MRTGFTPLTIVASRSHRTHETDLYIRNFEAAEIVSVGSSLKFCMIASGEADLYPRFGTTMEWDTAAGDAILRAAGGMTTTLDGAPLDLRQARPRRAVGFRQPVLRGEGPHRRARLRALLRGDLRRVSRHEAADRADDAVLVGGAEIGVHRQARIRSGSASETGRPDGVRWIVAIGDLLVQRLDVVDHGRDAERLQMRLERVAMRRLDRILGPGRARALARRQRP